jgi:hypothetical protein
MSNIVPTLEEQWWVDHAFSVPFWIFTSDKLLFGT